MEMQREGRERGREGEREMWVVVISVDDEAKRFRYSRMHCISGMSRRDHAGETSTKHVSLERFNRAGGSKKEKRLLRLAC
jgi:hypothetical protein